MTIKLTPKKGSPLDPGGLRDLEHAVIEAAQAMILALRVWGEGNHEFVRLRNAVEALEAAEKTNE